MTIVQIEYFLAVANCGSFSLAAEKCFVTQPSLSTQIKNLEDELGVILLNRSEKPIAPTEAGRIVIARSKEALMHFGRIKEAVGEMKNTVSGELRLAVIPSIAPYLIHTFVPVFMKRYPEVKLTVTEMFTRDIITALRKDTIDTAILAGGFTDPQEIDEQVIFKDRFYLYASEKHPLYNYDNVRAEDIDIGKMLLLADGHCLRTQVLDLCNSGRNVDNLFFESGSLETIVRLVDATDAITILPEMAAGIIPVQNRKRLKPIEDERASRDISLAVSKTFIKKKRYEALRETILEAVG